MPAVKNTFEKNLHTMPIAELDEANKKASKKLVRNLVTGVASTVAIHFASSALIDMIENRTKDPEAADHEVPDNQ